MESFVVIIFTASLVWAPDGHVLAIKGTETVMELPSSGEVLCDVFPFLLRRWTLKDLFRQLGDDGFAYFWDEQTDGVACHSEVVH